MHEQYLVNFGWFFFFLYDDIIKVSLELNNSVEVLRILY